MTERISRIYKLTEELPLPKQAIMLNVSANKKQVIQIIVDRLCSFWVSNEKFVVVTGPESHPIQVGIGEWQTPKKLMLLCVFPHSTLLPIVHIANDISATILQVCGCRGPRC